MAIIYSYPNNNNIKATDILVGTSTVLVAGKPKNQTKSFEVGELANFIAPLIAPTLNEVLTNGNVSELDAKVGSLYLYDITNDEYGKVTINNNSFKVYDYNDNPIFANEIGISRVWNSIGIEGAISYSSLTGGRIYSMPDQSGTVALTSDIPPFLVGYVPYTGATGAVNLGAYDLTLNGSTIGRGGGQNFTNIVFGIAAGLVNTTGNYNSFVGFNTGYYNISGSNNTVLGSQAFYYNTTGNNNTALGTNALYRNTSGSDNIAIGYNALNLNTTGTFNVAIGTNALYNNTTGVSNTANGDDALYNNNVGIRNTAMGYVALFTNTSGPNNTAIGYQALYSNTIGSGNTAVGDNALFNVIGGINNVGLGFNARPLNAADTNSIVIGYNAVGLGPQSVVIGNTNITTTRLRGAVLGGSFVKDAGTIYETLRANGSVTTDGTLYKITSTAFQLVSGTSRFYSAAIPSNIFTSGDNLKINTYTTTVNNSLAAVITRYYINTTPTIVGAIQIGNFSGNIGSVYYPMDRVYWVNGGNFYARNFAGSNSTSANTGTAIIDSTPIPAGSFYIIVEIATTGTDLACLSSFQITKS